MHPKCLNSKRCRLVFQNFLPTRKATTLYGYLCWFSHSGCSFKEILSKCEVSGFFIITRWIEASLPEPDHNNLKKYYCYYYHHHHHHRFLFRRACIFSRRYSKIKIKKNKCLTENIMSPKFPKIPEASVVSVISGCSNLPVWRLISLIGTETLWTLQCCHIRLNHHGGTQSFFRFLLHLNQLQASKFQLFRTSKMKSSSEKIAVLKLKI